MNEKQQAASEALEMLGLPLPHTEEECNKFINFRNEWFKQTNVSSIEAARVQAERGTLGLFAGLQEIANELKASRKTSADG